METCGKYHLIILLGNKEYLHSMQNSIDGGEGWGGVSSCGRLEKNENEDMGKAKGGKEIAL